MVPPTPPPKDRFDDLPADRTRVGAHRAENPRIRGGAVLLWSAVATVVLVALGIFGTLLATGRIATSPTPAASATQAVEADPVIDTSYAVTVLNATPQSGLAGQVRDTVITAGWSADDVIDSEAGSDDFPTTTVFYANAEDEGPARGLAEAIGGAAVELSEAYQPEDDPETETDESAVHQLVVVIGLDRTDEGSSSPTP